MKLYTEEDLKKVISIYSEEYKTSTDEILSELNLKPIELPRDEHEYLSNHPEVLALDYIDGFLDGAWWVKDKIQRGNK